MRCTEVRKFQGARKVKRDQEKTGGIRTNFVLFRKRIPGIGDGRGGNI